VPDTLQVLSSLVGQPLLAAAGLLAGALVAAPLNCGFAAPVRGEIRHPSSTITLEASTAQC